jgi:hydroxyacylglutathione hydrolase
VMKLQRMMYSLLSGSLLRPIASAFGIPVRNSCFLSSISNVACADVHLVPMFGDNYGLILVDRLTNKAALIDPGDPDPVIKAARDLGSSVELALITHKHNDHVGGNSAVKDAFSGINIVGTSYEKIPHVMQEVKEGDSVIMGSLKIEVIHVPCHTKGHVAYYVTSNDADVDKNKNAPILFSGDTLFVGGCGRFFEGTATEMLRNMDRLGALPSATQVYCAHEYTLGNLKFLASVDPECSSKILEEVSQKRDALISTVPTTIGRELEYNLFMKCREERTQTLLNRKSPVDTMARLRELKNKF